MLFRAVKWKLVSISCHCYGTAAHKSIRYYNGGHGKAEWLDIQALTNPVIMVLEVTSPAALSAPLPDYQSHSKRKCMPSLQPLQCRAWHFSINPPLQLYKWGVLTQELWWWFNTRVYFTSQYWRCPLSRSKHILAPQKSSSQATILA